MTRRAAALALGLAAQAAGPAAAETSPLTIIGMRWDNCIEVFGQLKEMHLSRGGTVLDEFEQPGVLSAAVALGEELIVIRCERRRDGNADLEMKAEPY